MIEAIEKPVRRPITIWTAWLQGRENAPAHVQRIFNLWERLNPDMEVRVIAQKQAEDILSELGIHQERITPQVTTNLVRTYLIANEGGFWVDSTLLPTQPLNKWISDEIVDSGFFAFRSTGDPNLVLQNWFLYSDRGNPLATEWLEIYADYFRHPRHFPSWKRAVRHAVMRDYIAFRSAHARGDFLWFVDPDRGRNCRFYPYAAHNYNFAYLIQNRSDLRQIWENVPSRTHALPSLIGMLAADPETSDGAFLEAATEILNHSPVHKLNHRDHRFHGLIDALELLL